MLLRAAAGLVPAGTTVEIASIREIPLYDGDVEASSGVPEPVRALKERLAAAEGLLIATPEYNNSIPGVFKNAIDWMSRPGSDIPRVFGGKPVGIMGASLGPGATNLAQAAWLPVLRTLMLLPYFGRRMSVAHAAKVFDAAGAIVDPAVRDQLEKYMAGFVQFVTQMRAPALRS
jgi:NAD(P)H-dependent FMN reductase